MSLRLAMSKHLLAIQILIVVVLTPFIDTCDPINTTGMSHLKVYILIVSKY